MLPKYIKGIHDILRYFDPLAISKENDWFSRKVKQSLSVSSSAVVWISYEQKLCFLTVSLAAWSSNIQVDHPSCKSNNILPLFSHRNAKWVPGATIEKVSVMSLTSADVFVH